MTTYSWVERRLAAEKRAGLLLVSMLNERQRRQFAHHQWFDCVGSRGTRYRIEYGRINNVSWRRPSGRLGGRMCAAPEEVPEWDPYTAPHPGRMPIEDQMLGQLLTLVADEFAYLRVANLVGGRWPPAVRRPRRCWWSVRSFIRDVREVWTGG